MARFAKLRHHTINRATNAMSAIAKLLKNIQDAPTGVTLAELLVRYPDVARRTAQRGISQLIDAGQVTAIGKGRARRYVAARTAAVAAPAPSPSAIKKFTPMTA